MPQDGMVLHVMRAEGVVKIVDDREDVLRFRHDVQSENVVPRKTALRPLRWHLELEAAVSVSPESRPPD